MTLLLEVALGTVADLRPGRTPKQLDRYLKEHPRDDRSVPFYKAGDSGTNPKMLREGRKYLARDEVSALGLAVVPPGSTVFPKAGGAIATNRKRVVQVAGPVDLNCMAVVPGDRLDAQYLRWWFESVDLTEISDGSILPQLSKRRVSELCYRSRPCRRRGRSSTPLKTTSQGSMRRGLTLRKAGAVRRYFACRR